MAPRMGFMTRAAWDRVREGEFVWHDDNVCEVMSILRDEVQLRSYVNVTTGVSTRDKRLKFCAGEEGSISVDAQLFLIDGVVVREDGRLLITADEIRVVRAAAARFTDESESSGSESERDTSNMDTHARAARARTTPSDERYDVRSAGVADWKTARRGNTERTLTA